MKTRNADAPKPKGTPPARKSAAKSSPATAVESPSPKYGETKRVAAMRANKFKMNKTPTAMDSEPEPSPPGKEVGMSPVGRFTKAFVRRTPLKSRDPPTLGKGVSVPMVESAEDAAVQENGEKLKEEVEVSEVVEEERSSRHVVNASEQENCVSLGVDNRLLVDGKSGGGNARDEEMAKEEKTLGLDVEDVVLVDEVCGGGNAGDEERAKEEKTIGLDVDDRLLVDEVCGSGNAGDEERAKEEKTIGLDVDDRLLVDEVCGGGNVGEEEKAKEVIKKEDSRDGENKEQRDSDSSTMKENADGDSKKEAAKSLTVTEANEDMVCEEKVDMGEHEDKESMEIVDTEDHGEDTKTTQDDERELKEIVKERKNRKEREVFIGGLDRDATEDDVRRVFEKMGEIVQIRLHKSLSTSKNKGYAFVEYAKKECTKRALAEMKNPVIHGKRCGTAPSEDNDTLFLGNICNTWTNEGIGQKLRDYGVAGVENITLVPDLQREGLSRGFAFVEFSCHADAMFAYKRLQKPDVVFGHPERTAKIAFAEPLREPDPDVMAQIKSVFVDGLPPHWDEVRVREQLKGYGEILRICLARNMSTARRKDYGFVDFPTHEAAIACIDGINNAQLNDGYSKMKLKARLSNPMPKTQAVKGGLCGGFRIGRADGGFPRYGRGFNRGGNHINNANFSCDRGFYQGGRGRMGRVDFIDRPGRQMFGQEGRRGSFRGGHCAASRGDGPDFGRQWYGAAERDYGMHYPPRRQNYSPEGHFDYRPFPGNQFDDPYFYGDDVHGMKRPSYMLDYDPEFLEPSRIRPRFDHADPAPSFHRNHYHDGYEAGSSVHAQDYYGPDYAGGPHSYFYGVDHLHPPPYGHGYYF